MNPTICKACGGKIDPPAGWSLCDRCFWLLPKRKERDWDRYGRIAFATIMFGSAGAIVLWLLRQARIL